MGFSAIKDLVIGALTPLVNLIDELHTSKEEKLQIKEKMLSTYVQFIGLVLEYEEKQTEMKAKVVMAEATSESWLTKSWRPIVMLTFAALVVARWLGFTVANLTPELEVKLFDVVELGLGGYVIGRSAEKIVPAAIEALKQKEKT